MKITVETTVNSDLQKAWDYYTQVDHVLKWNMASEDWHCPSASNNLQVGGIFNYRMEAKDGSAGFDFSGEYTKVEEKKLIEYKLGDEREVSVSFEEIGDQVKVTVVFDAETENTPERQKFGWQSILDNYKNCVEQE